MKARKCIWMGMLAMVASCGPLGPAEPDFSAHGVSARTVRQIERRIDMPQGANDLRDYARYYALGIEPDTVQAVFLLRESFPWLPDDAVPLRGIPNAYAVERLPIIFDGMCAVVNAEFHLSAMGLTPPAARVSLAPVEAQDVQCGGI